MAYTIDLSGKVAIVTGGGRGIGREIALGLASAGAFVVVAARTKDQVDSVAAEISAVGGQALAVACDLMDQVQIEALVAKTLAAFGRIDILVNNAARSVFKPLMDVREDAFDKIFGVNIRAVFLLSRLSAKEMAKTGGGRIINISSTGAARGGSGMGLYHASKAALNMLTMCMAVEWAGLNINVNAVGPTMTKTDFSQPIWANPAIEAAIASRIPKGRLADPTDIVGTVIYLCSNLSGFVTGETIYVDGGALANT